MTVVAVTGAAAPAGAAPSDGPIVVASRTDLNSSIGLGRSPDTGRVQKLAQTFVAPKDAHKLASVSLVAAGPSDVVVKVYEIGKRPPFGTLLGTTTVGTVAGWGGKVQWHTSRLRPAIVVEPGKRYSLVLKTERRRRAVAVAGGHSDYRGGQQWCYCPRWKNGGVTIKRWWQSAEEIGRPGTDLAFKAHFWRKG